MRHLCYLSFIALFAFNAQAGYILPELGRSKTRENTSAIAVGFSDRNTAVGNFFHQSFESTTNNVVDYESTANYGYGSLFMTTSAVRFETTLGFGASEQKNKLNNITTDYDFYNFNGELAVPFGNFVAGLGLSAVKGTETDSGSKNVSKDFTATPVFGMKIAPQMALGLGIKYNNSKFTNAGTKYPDLNTLTFFTGFAYGVDRKIGEEGFGIEGVITHRAKKQSDQENGLTISQGSSTGLIINGNYIVSILDLNFSTSFSKGKNYRDTESTKIIAFGLAPEFIISMPFYLTPTLSYEITKNTTTTGFDSSTEDEALSYGLTFGIRSAVDDFAFSYLHTNGETTPGTTEDDGNIFKVTYAYHF